MAGFNSFLDYPLIRIFNQLIILVARIIFKVKKKQKILGDIKNNIARQSP